MHAVWFGSVGFKNTIQSKLNQTNAVLVESVDAVLSRQYNLLFPTLKLS